MRESIYQFQEEVEKCLDYIAQADCISDQSFLTNSGFEDKDKEFRELSNRRKLMMKLKHNMGRTALMLSGGGAQSMHHLGTIKALCESKLYDDIEVISGASGGSISAAFCAILTREELLKDVCVPHVSTDFRLNGQMKEENICWFPSKAKMTKTWLEHKLLVEPQDFKRCCEFYFGDVTFDEAFQRTGKHVCIAVSASRSNSNSSATGSGVQRLLLNHISTPHVTIASAVAASCALPGVMAPVKLVTKKEDSKQEFFEVDGHEWIDGSVQADLPFARISSLFNVTNYIVCQTNFHILPFLHKAHHPNKDSFYWRAFQSFEWDIRNRVLNLSQLGLFPTIFGQDVSKVFQQKYDGDLTLIPKFNTMQVFGFKSLSNPSCEDMEEYLRNGQITTWPYLSAIKEMLRLETAIDRSIRTLNKRVDILKCHNSFLVHDCDNFTSELTFDSFDKTSSTYDSYHNDDSSIFSGSGEVLQQKVIELELEVLHLKKQIEIKTKIQMVNV